jgi:hypothetical protein
VMQLCLFNQHSCTAIRAALLPTCCQLLLPLLLCLLLVLHGNTMPCTMLHLTMQHVALERAVEAALL